MNILNTIRNNIESKNESDELSYFDFHRDRYGLLAKIFSDNYNGKEQKFLEIGAYLGHLCMIAKLIGFDAYGIDVARFVDISIEDSKVYGYKLSVCDLSKEAIPFESEFFDLVSLSETLEHLNFHPSKALQEAYRVLKTGGLLVVTTPNLLRLNNRIKMLIGRSINSDLASDYHEGIHFREYSPAEVSYLLNRAGFSTVVVKTMAVRYPGQNILQSLVNNTFSAYPGLRSDILAIALK